MEKYSKDGEYKTGPYYVSLQNKHEEVKEKAEAMRIDYEKDVKIDVGAAVYSTPLIAGDKLYFGAWDKNFYCISKYDGSLLWKFITGGPVSSSPFLWGSKIYFGSDDTFIYCLSEEGSLVWKTKTGGRVISSPVVIDGVLYVGSNDHKFYAVNAENGSVIWTFQTGDVVVGSPAIVGNYVYFGSYDSYFYCLNRHNGTLEWKFRTNTHIGSTPVITDKDGNEVSRPKLRTNSLQNLEDGIIHFGSVDFNHYAISLKGKLLWKFRTNYVIASCPTVYNNVIYFTSYDRYIYALSANNGNFIWRYLTNGGSESSPLVHNDTIFFGSLDGFVYALRLDGFMKWKFMTNSGIGCSPVVDDDKIFIGSFDGFLYALTLDGEMIWKFGTGYELRPAKFDERLNELVTGATKKFMLVWKPETITSKKTEASQAGIYPGPIGDNSMVSYGSAFTGYKTASPYKMQKKEK
jgi:outer membrane protein assembly factor BamB